MMERRSCIRSTLLYAYRGLNGDQHEHKIEKISHIGGNIFSLNPVKFDNKGNVESVNVDAMVEEFEEHNSNYNGLAQNLYKHLTISIAPGESLTNFQWFEAANETMKALGFNESTKWTAVKHNDKDHEHIHIIYSLVRDNGELIDQHLDSHKGFEAMRRLELRYGLRVLDNPEDSMNVDASKAQIKAAMGKGNISKDWGRILRARISKMKDNNGGHFPHSMSAFAVELYKVGVEVNMSIGKDGNPKGISYKLKDADNCPWVSGSKLKGTVYSLQALLRNGITYNALRDNVFLKLIEPGQILGIGIAGTSTSIFACKVNLDVVRKARDKKVQRNRDRKAQLIDSITREPFIELIKGVPYCDKQMVLAVLKIMEALRLLFGGMSEEEEKLLHLIAEEQRMLYQIKAKKMELEKLEATIAEREKVKDVKETLENKEPKSLSVNHSFHDYRYDDDSMPTF